jgi:predicted O-methyltransferase YrrM
MDTLPFFRRTVEDAGLEDVVVAVISDSPTVARHWRTPLGLCFIDGGHAYDAALADFEAWSPHVAPGGLLVFHDVFEDPAAGGQAPYLVWQVAVGSGRFTPVSTTGSLRVLRRQEPAGPDADR